MPTPLHRAVATLLAVALCGVAVAGEPETYTLDPVHTRVLIAVEHAGLSKALGMVSGPTGTLLFDRDDWRTARLDVRVPMGRLDFGDAKMNSAVLATNLLDGKRHPEARFVSTSVEPIDADHATACGELTLRGVTKPLCLEVTLNAIKRHPLPPFRRTAGFSAMATLSRADFGIDVWKSVIGDTVELRIEAEAVRSNHVDDAMEPTAPSDEPVPTEATPTSQATPPEPTPEPTP